MNNVRFSTAGHKHGQKEPMYATVKSRNKGNGTDIKCKLQIV